MLLKFSAAGVLATSNASDTATVHSLHMFPKWHKFSPNWSVSLTTFPFPQFADSPINKEDLSNFRLGVGRFL